MIRITGERRIGRKKILSDAAKKAQSGCFYLRRDQVQSAKSVIRTVDESKAARRSSAGYVSNNRSNPAAFFLSALILVTLAACVLTTNALSTESENDGVGIAHSQSLNDVDTYSAGTVQGGVTERGKSVIEVTGSAKHTVFSSDVDVVSVYGADCVIHILEGAQVGKIELSAGSLRSRVVIDGVVREIAVYQSGAQITGTGRIDTVILNCTGTKISARYSNIIDLTDRGLSGASIRISAPDVLPAGEDLIVAAEILDADSGKNCVLSWYVDGVAVSEYAVTSGDALPSLSHSFLYDRYMIESARIEAKVSYVSLYGEQYELSDEVSVKLENYDLEYWTRRDAPDVLEKVTTGYKGDFTLEWALENDLTDYEKEVWVNAKGYSSDSEYLIWISIAYQRVNIFQGFEKNWELIRSCIVGTGAPGSGTGTGVFKTTYKQKNGWTTSKYTVRPVVRFRQGSGYAFHSRLYYPNNTSKFIDSRIGFPVSAGCIRMYDEDIYFIYDNVPDGTTVVVF